MVDDNIFGAVKNVDSSSSSLMNIHNFLAILIPNNALSLKIRIVYLNNR